MSYAITLLKAKGMPLELASILEMCDVVVLPCTSVVLDCPTSLKTGICCVRLPAYLCELVALPQED